MRDLGHDGQVVIAGEIKSDAYIDMQETARRVINEIGYDRSELASTAIRAACFWRCMSRAPI